MEKYQVHYDEENQQYWIGVVVASTFVQRVGNYYQYKKVAERVASRLNKAVK